MRFPQLPIVQVVLGAVAAAAAAALAAFLAAPVADLFLPSCFSRVMKDVFPLKKTLRVLSHLLLGMSLAAAAAGLRAAAPGAVAAAAPRAVAAIFAAAARRAVAAIFAAAAPAAAAAIFAAAAPAAVAAPIFGVAAPGAVAAPIFAAAAPWAAAAIFSAAAPGAGGAPGLDALALVLGFSSSTVPPPRRPPFRDVGGAIALVRARLDLLRARAWPRRRGSGAKSGACVCPRCGG